MRVVCILALVATAVAIMGGSGAVAQVVPEGFEYLFEYETGDLATLVTEEGGSLLRSYGVSDATSLSRNQLIQLAITLETAKMNLAAAKQGGSRGASASVEVLYCVG